MTDTFTPATFSDTLARQQSHFAYTDPLQFLPVGAPADKFQKLKQNVEDVRSLIPDFEQRREASNEKLAAAQRLKRLLDPPMQGGFNLPDDHPSVVVARREAERTAAASKQLDDLYAARSAAASAASNLLSVVTTWLQHGRPAGTVLEQIATDPPKLARNETIFDAIARLRQRCCTLRADLHTIESAPFPSTYCKARARAQVEQLTMRGAVNVSRLIEADGDIEFPALQVRAMVHNAQPGAIAFYEGADSVALTCWLQKDALIKRLDVEIDAEADDKNALSPEMRQQRAAEVQADLLSVERAECELVWQSQGQLAHRSDCSPLAILGCRLLTAPRPTALPTSPGLVVDVLRPG